MTEEDLPPHPRARPPSSCARTSGRVRMSRRRVAYDPLGDEGVAGCGGCEDRFEVGANRWNVDEVESEGASEHSRRAESYDRS